MHSLDSVLWTKGTLLTPQHLQAQDQYYASLLSVQVGSLLAYPWGFTQLEFDASTLPDTVTVRVAGARFNDGLMVAPVPHVAPPPRRISERWLPDQRTMMLYVGVAEFRSGARNVTFDGAGGGTITRWKAEEVQLRDETTGLEERAIQLAQPNLRLIFEGESTEGVITLPLTRLIRSADGRVRYDDSFIPPVLNFKASPVLFDIALRLLERVSAKASTLSASRRQRNQALADFSVTDVASFWLLYTLNAHLPGLRHLVEVRSGHPLELWEALLAFTSSLTTFASTPIAMPTYDHSKLGVCFPQLEARLLELLDTAIPEVAVALPFRKDRASIHTVSISQEKWLQAPTWFLGVKADMRQAELVQHVIQRCKLGSADMVDVLVSRALPGLILEHVQKFADVFPVKAGFLYFRIRRSGDAWTAVTQSRKISAYLPSEIPAPRLELVVVME